MRVIAGAAKGHQLKSPRGAGTRPTADKIKGAVFSMLESMLAARRGVEISGAVGDPATGVWSGMRVLDLYAGTGALGIEALSRGAATADFVDASAGCRRLIEENLRRTRLAGRGRVLAMTVQQALSRLAQQSDAGAYDIVLVDAPYCDPGLFDVMETLGQGGLVAEGGLVAVEHSRRTAIGDSYGSLRLIRRRRHGDTVLSLYEQLLRGRPVATDCSHLDAQSQGKGLGAQS